MDRRVRRRKTPPPFPYEAAKSVADTLERKWRKEFGSDPALHFEVHARRDVWPNRTEAWVEIIPLTRQACEWHPARQVNAADAPLVSCGGSAWRLYKEAIEADRHMRAAENDASSTWQDYMRVPKGDDDAHEHHRSLDHSSGILFGGDAGRLANT